MTAQKGADGEETEDGQTDKHDKRGQEKERGARGGFRIRGKVAVLQQPILQ